MAQYIGRAKVGYDGKTLDTMPGAKINLGGMARKVIEGDHSIGYSESQKAATVECELLVGKNTPIEEIRNIVGATVTFRGDIGTTWMVRNAFVVDPLDVTGGDGGKTKVKFAGDPAEQV